MTRNSSTIQNKEYILTESGEEGVDGPGEVSSAHCCQVSTVTSVKRGFTFALRRSTLDFCLGGQRS